MTDNEQSSINDSNEMGKQHQHVLQKSMEPGVINDELLRNFVRSHRANDKVARLCRNSVIDYDTITELCLDFQNLMKIDHIWMCFNLIKLSLKCNKLTKIENLDNLKELRELNLSQNFIQVMENLEYLTKLESLTLFQNNIRKIENLNELNQLIRLNLGNNIIETDDGIVSLRQRTKLFSLILSGNPICGKQSDYIDFRLYIAAYLPHVQYYDYSVITDAERNNGRHIYKNKLRILKETESEQLAEEHKHLAENEQLRLATASFVENLDQHQLFETLFANDTDIDLLVHMDHSTQLYRNRIYAATQDIYTFGIRNHQHCTNEVKHFDEALANGRKEIQTKSIELIDKFLMEKTNLIETTKGYFHRIIELADNSKEQNHHQHETISEKFMLAIDNIWYSLMELETTLHERINETMIVFNETIGEIIENFIDQCNERFDCIRSACVDYFRMSIADDDSDSDSVNHRHHHSNNQFGLASSFSLKRKDHFEQHLERKKSMQIRHMNIINQRMDSLCSQMRKMLSNVMAKNEQIEYDRNRMKVLEISNFVDNERSAYTKFKENLIEKYSLHSIDI